MKRFFERSTRRTFTLVALLEERIRRLEEQLKQDSHKPPSSDAFKRATTNVRPKSKRSPGAQPGHEGTTLKTVSTPEHIVKHSVSACLQLFDFGIVDCGFKFQVSITDQEAAAIQGAVL